jgi:hypothetical protein
MRENFVPKYQDDVRGVPFHSAEEAWFWFLQAQTARAEGARIVAGAGCNPRPCEPVDIFRALERLYRARRLVMDHMLVLRYYGRRMMPPDPHCPKEVRAYGLWTEALERLEEVLLGKGIVVRDVPQFHWGG